MTFIFGELKINTAPNESLSPSFPTVELIL